RLRNLAMLSERYRQDDRVGLEGFPKRPGDDRGPYRPGVRRQGLRRPAAGHRHFDAFTGEGVGQSLAYRAESYDCISHSFVLWFFNARSELVTAARFNRLARNPVAFRGGQEGHDSGDFRRLAKAPERDFGLDRLYELGILAEGGVPVRSGVARRYGVRGNSAWPKLGRERVGKVVDRRFGHRIDRRGRDGLGGRGGGDVDDACTVGETIQGGLNDEERRAGINGDQGV